MTAPAPTRFAPLHVVPPLEEIDLPGAERAATDFLSALGVATDTAATTDTPARMARAYAATTSALLGALREDPRSRAEFLALTTPTPSTPAGGRHG